jgi:hypothetical protein
MQDVALIMIASLIVLFVRLCWADMDSKLDQKWMAGTSPAVPSIQLSIRKLRQLREMAKQSSLKWSIAVDRYRQTHHTSGLAIDVVAAVDPQKLPAVSLDQTRELAS